MEHTWQSNHLPNLELFNLDAGDVAGYPASCVLVMIFRGRRVASERLGTGACGT